MNTKSIVFILLYSAALFNFNIPLAALAESNGDSELNISGKVVAPSCTIAPDTVNGSVDLGEVLSERLQSAGSFSAWSQFSLNLTECPATTTEVVVYFSGGRILIIRFILKIQAAVNMWLLRLQMIQARA